MFRLLKAILKLNIKEYIKYNTIKWTRNRLHKVLNYWKDIIKKGVEINLENTLNFKTFNIMYYSSRWMELYFFPVFIMHYVNVRSHAYMQLQVFTESSSKKGRHDGLY